MDYDVEIQWEGSLTLVTPLTEPALDWCDEHIEGGLTWCGRSYVVENRYVMPILGAMIQEGFRVDA